MAELGNKKYGQSVGNIFILVLDQLFPSPKWQFILSSIFSSLSTKALFLGFDVRLYGQSVGKICVLVHDQSIPCPKWSATALS